ncbi:sulfatase-like hydrolase/transferase [Nocardioides sp. CFH 31398]|uniref:sulfatase-like hydrolase/transferase n=1 Tax=Nocardioides sp. CFH 31398 TaxID=2919579 RepID=UPI001F069DF5|nr:sulfatase-like hydrolase/transferase [Nocardioides sp. CFH 31398]MCH1866010.1 sulfatase-like hydrolase/transferase [Nocardioides sp. CFH 31398]
MRSRRRLACAAIGAAVASTCALTAPPGAAEPGASRAAPADTRPNVVLVVVDDLGWGDVASGLFNDGHPNGFVDTPAMARLAEEGTTFPNAYGALSCAPSRMSLLTGQYAQGPDNGVYGGVNPNSVPPFYDGRPPTLRGIDNQNPTGASRLPASATTVPEMLDDAGYWNAHVGKFHVTAGTDQITRNHGYDVNYGGSRAGNPGSYTATRRADGTPVFGAKVDRTLDRFAAPYTREYLRENVLPFTTGVPRDAVLGLAGERKHLTDAVGDAAVHAVRRGARTRDPFFVAVNQFGVHDPVGPAQARPDLLAKYERRRPRGEGRVPAYAALVEGVDQTVGRLLAELRERPDPRSPGQTLADNTIVLLTSDNGGRLSRNRRDPDGFGADNGPLRGEKMTLWEGGIRVPTAAWSGTASLVRPGVVNRGLVHMTDLAATLADAARVRARDRRGLDGFSIAPALTGGEVGRESLLLHYPGYSLGRGRDQRPATVLRSGDWKARYDYEARTLRLFAVGARPSETVDRARADPGVVRRLGVAMATELERTTTPLPTLLAKAAPLRIDVRPGTVTYADGVLTRHRRARTLRLRAGDEVPLVVR